MSELKTYIGPHPTDHTLTEYYLKSETDKVLAEKDAEIATLKKEVSRQKRLRCYNLKMWCSTERFTHRALTIPDERRWWERHFYSACRIWEKFKEAK